MHTNQDLEKIEDVDVSKEMETSFLEYAYSVIYSRALPDARDGLKPVQRRILFMMTQMGLTPEKGHVKSARVVGEVMGKLHPHGDASIYDTLVRLAQGFSMSVPMVDGHGNFGSLDDGPAASRYTEARLTKAAIAMTDGLKEDVVDFQPNYDNQFMQPEVLPALIPNLIVNGASGIAVGMATNLAPHNLGEVIEGAKHLLYNPEATIPELMNYIPGPDLPGGGTIVGLEGVKDAYETGRGQFRTRAKVSIEKVTARKTGLVVTELPYLVGPERVIEKMKQGVESKKISGISNVEDLSDRKNGLRMVITLKTGFSPEGVLEQLYRTTPLEDSFSINSVALVDGEPRTLNLKEMLRVYLDHRIDVVTRRSKFRLIKRKDRLHLVEGLLLAIVDIDAVIQIIRASDDGEQAKSRLKTAFDFSDLQAEYILELRLRRLTKFSRIELEQEKSQLIAEIAELEGILADRAKLYRVVETELDELAATLARPRRTVLMGAVQRPSKAKESAGLQVADTPALILLSTEGKVVRTPLSLDHEPSLSNQLSGAIAMTVATSTRSDLQLVLSDGRAVRFNAVDIPEVPPTSISFKAGVSILSYAGLSNVRPVGIFPLKENMIIGLVTREGVVKRVSAAEVANKSEWEIISLKDTDQLVAAFNAPDDSEFVIISDNAQLLRFKANLVRVQGKPAGGMAGIALKDASRVIYANAATDLEETRVITVAASLNSLAGVDIPSVKISNFSDFPAKGRATGGVRAHRFLKGESVLTVAWVGAGVPLALDSDKKKRLLPEELDKRDASGSFSDGHIETVGYVI